MIPHMTTPAQNGNQAVSQAAVLFCGGGSEVDFERVARHLSEVLRRSVRYCHQDTALYDFLGVGSQEDSDA